MSADHFQADPIMAALRELRSRDVSPVRAQRLRTRCLREFKRRETERKRPSTPTQGAWIRVTGAVVGAWSVVYFLETIRLAAAVFGF